MKTRRLLTHIFGVIISAISIICSVVLIQVGQYWIGLLLAPCAITGSQVGVKQDDNSFLESVLTTSGGISLSGAVAVLINIWELWQPQSLYLAIIADVLLIGFGVGVMLISIGLMEWIRSKAALGTQAR